jgi:lipoprotein-releasing system permease protein
VMTRDPYRVGSVAQKVRAILGPDYYVDTWIEQNRQLFGALRVEKNMMFFLLIFITIVAAFGITTTLITVTIQKTKEIGLLKAIGFSSGSVMRIFFWVGWVEGMLGTSLGIVTGLLALHFRNDLMRWLSDTFHLELFPKELYRLSEIPSQTSVMDVTVVAVAVVLICTLAGAIPACRAARLDPVEALRHE